MHLVQFCTLINLVIPRPARRLHRFGNSASASGGRCRCKFVAQLGAGLPDPTLRVRLVCLPAILYLLYLGVGRGGNESQTLHRRPPQEASPRFAGRRRGGCFAFFGSERQLTHFHRNRADDDRNPVRTARFPSAEPPSRPSSVSEIVSSSLIGPRRWQGQNATTRIHDTSQADDTGL